MSALTLTSRYFRPILSLNWYNVYPVTYGWSETTNNIITVYVNQVLCSPNNHLFAACRIWTRVLSVNGRTPMTKQTTCIHILLRFVNTFNNLHVYILIFYILGISYLVGICTMCSIMYKADVPCEKPSGFFFHLKNYW